MHGVPNSASKVEISATSREELEQDRTKLKTTEAEVEQARKQLTRTSEIVKLNPVIPSATVQNMKEQKIVFATTDKPNVFVMKPVRLGSEINGQYVILEDLNVGDKIVT